MRWSEAREKLAGIENLFHPSQARVLFELVRRLPDGERILEIGAWKGYSTCALALGCTGTFKRITTIDTFAGIQENTNVQADVSYLNEFSRNVESVGLEDYVTVLVGRSEYFYQTWNELLGLLFIDGDHRLMRDDLEAFFPHLKHGGYLAMHDIYKSDRGNLANLWGHTRELGRLHHTYNMVWGMKL